MELKENKNQDHVPFKSGFASLVGRTNVGKSTLINKMLRQKVTIMSDKAQTTRHKIQMVYTSENYQIVFLDTPGFHKPQHKLGRHMVDVALGALKEMNILLFVTEPGPPGPGDRYILSQIKDLKVPVFLIINKIDKVNRQDLLNITHQLQSEFDFAETIPVSALTGDNVDTLISQIARYLPEGPKYYPDDMVTDRPERFIIGEFIREKVLQFTMQEIPHSITVMVEEIKERPQNVVFIAATIYLERDSQKKIVIGKNGSMLKKIGQYARQEIEQLLGSVIYLDLWVKVKKDWRNKKEMLRTFGYIDKD
ncbi:MAG: GTPase Era [Clostridiales bacterium]|nr:GTPase Era [Clostridiales bacterium]MCF8021439.1 GTPase Era [Clostridiales bacterium]